MFVSCVQRAHLDAIQIERQLLKPAEVFRVSFSQPVTQLPVGGTAHGRISDFYHGNESPCYFHDTPTSRGGSPIPPQLFQEVMAVARDIGELIDQGQGQDYRDVFSFLSTGETWYSMFRLSIELGMTE